MVMRSLSPALLSSPDISDPTVMCVTITSVSPLSVMLDLGLEGLKESTGDFVRIAVVRRLDGQRQTEAESPMSIRDSGCSSLRQKIKYSRKCSR